MKQTVIYWEILKTDILPENDEGYSFVYTRNATVSLKLQALVQSLSWGVL